MKRSPWRPLLFRLCATLLDWWWQPCRRSPRDGSASLRISYLACGTTVYNPIERKMYLPDILRLVVGTCKRSERRKYPRTIPNGISMTLFDCLRFDRGSKQRNEEQGFHINGVLMRELISAEGRLCFPIITLLTIPIGCRAWEDE